MRSLSDNDCSVGLVTYLTTGNKPGERIIRIQLKNQLWQEITSSVGTTDINDGFSQLRKDNET